MMNYQHYRSPDPFLNGGFFFAGGAQRRAIGGVRRLVVSRCSFGVLVNRGGCGMTTLIKHLSATRGFGDCAPEFVTTLQPTHAGLRPVDALALALGLSGPLDARSCIAAALEATNRQSIRTIWLIDQSTGIDLLGAQEVSKQFRSLCVIPAIDIIDVCRAQCNPGNLISLEPLSEAETSDYIHQSLRLARCDPAQLRATTISKRIHQITDGRIKSLSRIANNLISAVAWKQTGSRAA